MFRLSPIVTLPRILEAIPLHVHLDGEILNMSCLLGNEVCGARQGSLDLTDAEAVPPGSGHRFQLPKGSKKVQKGPTRGGSTPHCSSDSQDPPPSGSRYELAIPTSRGSKR